MAVLSSLEHPQVQNSCCPCSTSASTHTDENTIIHGDEPKCPAPADGIDLMSERDPSVENAVNPNFNDNISDNGLTVITCQPLLLSALTILRIVELVCICMCQNSHVHLILLTLQLQTVPEQTNDGDFHQDISRQKHGIPFYKFPTHHGPARISNSSVDTDNIPAYPH
jgi:hypothetical protein